VFVQIGRVVGHAVSTVKHPSLHGSKLLLVQLLGTNDTPDGEPVLVIDHLGAGSGDRVLVCNEGAEARAMVKAKNSPVRWFVMGLTD
jgi:ethanolamine utilization protein EutN